MRGHSFKGKTLDEMTKARDQRIIKHAMWQAKNEEARVAAAKKREEREAKKTKQSGAQYRQEASERGRQEELRFESELQWIITTRRTWFPELEKREARIQARQLMREHNDRCTWGRLVADLCIEH